MIAIFSLSLALDEKALVWNKRLLPTRLPPPLLECKQRWLKPENARAINEPDNLQFETLQRQFETPFLPLGTSQSFASSSK
jgi:hypothetical protein